MRLQSRELGWVVGSLFWAASPGWGTPAITNISGSAVQGATLTITGSAFGSKPQAAPIVWDLVSEQYVNGVSQNAYAGLTDQQLINATIWDSENIAFSTSRPHRHSLITAQYAGWGQDGNPSKCVLKALPAPDSQRKFYLSFYRKDKYQASDDYPYDYSSKWLRVDNQYLDLVGQCYAGRSGLGMRLVSGDDVVAWIGTGDETVWTRWEVYVDATRQWFDTWKDGHYNLGSNSGAGGSVEFRPAGDWRFRTGIAGYQFASASLPSDHPVMPALFGYDQGGTGSSSGQEVDLSEIYYDNTLARVEISDQPAWDDTPSSEGHREIAGRPTAWTDGGIALVFYPGSFAAGQTVYFYVVDDQGEVNAAGYPVTLPGGASTPPSKPRNFRIR